LRKNIYEKGPGKKDDQSDHQPEMRRRIQEQAVRVLDFFEKKKYAVEEDQYTGNARCRGIKSLGI